MAGESDYIVTFEGVRKSYNGGEYVVKNLDLQVRRGEFLTLLGPSGSGKSTTLMMLAGFESPTQGNILLNNVVLNNIPAYKRDIGVVFQNYALFPHMTVEENVAFSLQVRKVPKNQIADKVKRALDMVHLGPFASRNPAQLSGGQQQRVAMARALVFEPKLVLLDEPLGALDKNLREDMQIELKHIHENLGVTMVFVTHDQDEALIMSDRIAVFNDGIIQQIDRPEVIYNQPKNKFVATFIGETNMLKGTISSLDDDCYVVALAGGNTIRAKRVESLSIGQTVSVSVRPEKASFIKQNSEIDYVNQITSSVVEIIYHGDHLCLTLNNGQDSDFIVKVPTEYLNHEFSPGQQVAVGFQPENCRLLSS
ncbi:MAG: putative spermidine/putrescine ABC transporter (ATP-binding component) [Osedax symbiont Rs1]|nr:MAG: putative spermidine/putrescine ABC transporter (ATP-binding component) [Osedax symbiont Rs1]